MSLLISVPATLNLPQFRPGPRVRVRPNFVPQLLGGAIANFHDIQPGKGNSVRLNDNG